MDLQSSYLIQFPDTPRRRLVSIFRQLGVLKSEDTHRTVPAEIMRRRKFRVINGGKA